MTERKKKICFFSGDITRGGGTERVAVLIAGHLAARGKYEVVFLSIVEQRKEMFFKPVREIPRHVLSRSGKWLVPGYAYLPMIPRLRRFIRQNEIDLIVDVDTILDLLTIPAIAGQKVKLIAWEHFNYNYEWPSPVYRRFRRRAFCFTARYADHIVTLTERDAENYRKNLGRKGQIEVIYNPMEFAAEEEKVNCREKILITVGRLTWVKGTDMLADLIPEILCSNQTWKWYVLGDGEDRGLLEKVRKKCQLQDRLILTGNVSNVEDYLKKASVYVMTSRAEGLPMCLLEAAACGMACVSFDIRTGPAEIIEDGENGFLVPAFDLRQMKEKIELLIHDTSLRERFQKNTEKTRTKFELEQILDQWEHLLKTVADSKK